MTPEEDKGRQILLVQIVLILLATLGVIGYYLSTEGAGRHTAAFVTRLVLTAALCFWLYRGSMVAKWIVVVVFGVAGVMGLVSVLSGSVVAFALGGGLAAVYLSSAILVWRSSSVNAFLRSQGRGRAPHERAAA